MKYHYPDIAALAIGAASNVLCRPDLGRKTLLGGALFLALYALFMALLVLFAPGYIERVWNLADLSGVLLAGVPLGAGVRLRLRHVLVGSVRALLLARDRRACNIRFRSTRGS